MNLWKSNDNDIDWLKEIKDKHLYKFLMFNMKDFHPSTIESLIKKVLDFAEIHTCTTKEDLSED